MGVGAIAGIWSGRREEGEKGIRNPNNTAKGVFQGTTRLSE